MKTCLKPRVLHWMWDVKHMWERWCDLCEDFSRPKELDTEQYIPYPGASKYLFHYRMTQDGVKKIDAIDIDAEVYFKRSWFMPWRKYHYVNLSEPRSDYTIVYCTPAFIFEGGRIGTVDECCSITEATLNRAHRSPEKWWVA